MIGPPQSQTVPVGSDVDFVATYLGIPTPVVAWLVDGQPIVNSDRIFVETVENGKCELLIVVLVFCLLRLVVDHCSVK